jgi:hypothetical protein
MGECIFEESNGNKFWSLNGKFHKEDGHAVELASGTRIWYLNGKKHREDGPAFESTDGGKFWYINGELHREDGPAAEYASGTKDWYLNHVRMSKEDFIKKVKNKKFTAAEIETLTSYGIQVDI